ncbi:MAG: zincin-like metallopeptidase domain-containing protein [Pontixanthobacter sp.]
MLHENTTVSDSGKGRTKKAKRASRTARKSRRSGRAAPKVSLYDEVTAQIIAQLEEGVFPWVKPWNAGNAVTGLPRNAISGRHYSGINILILWGAVIDGAYPSQDWLTFRQALAAGGCVRKGEKGRTIFYADRFTPDEEGGEKINEKREDDAPRSIPFLKRFTVFNAAQCDGLPQRLVATPAPLPERQLHEQAEGLIAATGADFRNGGARAFYSPAEDYVQVPPQPAFTHQIDFYRTALHELGHWTGHKSRLDRDQSGGFGCAKYAREELCAELASAFLCAALGIVPTVRHADYLGSWLSVLRQDNRAIFKAASAASKAADYLLAFTDQVPLRSECAA